MSHRSVLAGVLAPLAMAVFYVSVLTVASGPSHLRDQVAADWYWLVLILTGIGVQVGLLVELRARYRVHRAAGGGATVAAAGTGAGASGVGMVACCAHHIADLLPLAGAAGAAAFLLDYRVAFMVAGVGLNLLGITLAARRLRRTPRRLQETACAV